MKQLFLLGFLCISALTYSQNIKVDSQTYTPQQLIETILIGNNCISNVVVTNVSGGNFNATDQSYGYFDANGSTFPFQRGIVLSTGKLSNVEGPNTTLSDDNAPNWLGDTDLETILNENNTTNATIIEFEFTSLATQISFRYLFASEEYQENNANTCRFSDLFGFLIKNKNDSQYTNIALIPNTQTPVKVTTVHPAIPNGCAAQNEAYFGSWNNSTAPINFNGQTAVLTATATVAPNETYQVKLVIADEQNYRYDSAVFLEAGSFQLTTNLGVNQLIATNNPLCENETLLLDANQPNASSYKWFKNGVEILSETNSTFMVTEAGTYNVEISLQNNCTSYGEITIEYSTPPTVNNTTLTACDDNQDGLSVYNLWDAEQVVLNNDVNLTITNFYESRLDAEHPKNEIINPATFSNTVPQQVIFARVVNQLGCYTLAEITLNISNNTISIPDFEVCDTDHDGVATFNLTNLKALIQPSIPANATISIYKTLQDALNEMSILGNTYEKTTPNPENLYVKIKNGNACFALSTVTLKTNIVPQLLDDDRVFYCLNNPQNKVTLNAGLLNGVGNNPSYQWFLNGVLLPEIGSSIQITQPGNYDVLVSFSNNCAAGRTFTVSPSNTATIETISISQAKNNNTIKVSVSGKGLYQYALDTSMYQNEPIFNNVSSGIHTIYVDDVHGCGTVQKNVAVLGFPKYFTPNNDGFNDTWKPIGINTQFNADADIKIFNRYGKLIKQLIALDAGWNGTFRNALMPSDDYWYVVTLPDGTIYKGHFTLKR